MDLNTGEDVMENLRRRWHWDSLVAIGICVVLGLIYFTYLIFWEREIGRFQVDIDADGIPDLVCAFERPVLRRGSAQVWLARPNAAGMREFERTPGLDARGYEILTELDIWGRELND